MSEEVKHDEPRDGNNVSYSTPWVANSVSWSSRRDKPFRLAVSSYIQDYKNYVEVIEKTNDNSLVSVLSWEHCYPLTKLMFLPGETDNGDLLITTSDYLRLWRIAEGPQSDVESGTVAAAAAPAPVGGKEKLTQPGAGDSKISLKRCFENAKADDFCSPVTSCDWNMCDLSVVGCCSIDSTVTIWDVETGQQRTKLVAHDKDVYDMAFTSANTFVSCSADGSVRLFDLREMDHSTILFESQGLSPLLRVACNKQDLNYISTFGVESTEAFVIDIRFPCVPASVLRNEHKLPINGIAWPSQYAQHMCTVGEDGLSWIWDVTAEVAESMYEYKCGRPINNVAWSEVNDENWISITTCEGVTLLRL